MGKEVFSSLQEQHCNVSLHSNRFDFPKNRIFRRLSSIDLRQKLSKLRGDSKKLSWTRKVSFKTADPSNIVGACIFYTMSRNNLTHMFEGSPDILDKELYDVHVEEALKLIIGGVSA